MTYLLKQLEGNFESSSVNLLGFNWSKDLHAFISSYETQKTARASTTQGFQVRKYRSAIFYLNCGVRQMRLESEVDGLIMRKQA
jgi:hypothetical protein